MVKQSSRLDVTFSALADPTRRAMLTVLMRREATVSELAGPHNISLPAVMKHLSVLERAGLVSQRKIGRERHCRLTAHAMQPASDWIAQYRQFWERQFDALDRYLAESEPATPPVTQPATKENIVCRQRKPSPRSN
jgi:DNA-binding transcriptional ArsR family regulator